MYIFKTILHCVEYRLPMTQDAGSANSLCSGEWLCSLLSAKVIRATVVTAVSSTHR